MANAQRGKELEVAERRAEVGRLTRKRWSSRRIAEHLGVSHTTVSRDLELVLEQLKENAIKDADKIRADELETLADVEAKVIEILERSRSVESGADENGNELGLNLDITLRAADRLLKIQERRANLLGLDAPERIDATLTEGATPEAAARLVREQFAASGANDSNDGRDPGDAPGSGAQGAG